LKYWNVHLRTHTRTGTGTGTGTGKFNIIENHSKNGGDLDTIILVRHFISLMADEFKLHEFKLQ
jgi:hypothetical protein